MHVEGNGVNLAKNANVAANNANAPQGEVLSYVA